MRIKNWYHLANRGSVKASSISILCSSVFYVILSSMSILPKNSHGCPYLFLAPMEGIGDRCFRMAMASIGGFDMAVRDFLRVPSNAHVKSLWGALVSSPARYHQAFCYSFPYLWRTGYFRDGKLSEGTIPEFCRLQGIFCRQSLA